MFFQFCLIGFYVKNLNSGLTFLFILHIILVHRVCICLWYLPTVKTAFYTSILMGLPCWFLNVILHQFWHPPGAVQMNSILLCINLLLRTYCWSFESTNIFSVKNLEQMSGRQFLKIMSGGLCCLCISMMWSIKPICNFCPHAATLLIKGPTKPILEGDPITLECLYSDSEFNISQVHIEMFSKVRDKGRH